MKLLTLKDFLTGNFLKNRDFPGARVCWCSHYASVGIVAVDWQTFVVECENCGASFYSYDLEEWT
jgi:hypothetical protein